MIIQNIYIYREHFICLISSYSSSCQSKKKNLIAPHTCVGATSMKGSGPQVKISRATRVESEDNKSSCIQSLKQEQLVGVGT